MDKDIEGKLGEIMDHLPTLKLYDVKMRAMRAEHDPEYCIRMAESVFKAVKGYEPEPPDVVRKRFEEMLPVIDAAIARREELLTALVEKSEPDWLKQYDKEPDKELMLMYMVCELSAMMPEESVDVPIAHLTMRLIERTMDRRGLLIMPCTGGYELGPKKEVVQ